MAIKDYFALPKAPTLLEPHHHIFLVLYAGHSLEESHPFAEMQSVYSVADWVIKILCLMV